MVLCVLDGRSRYIITKKKRRQSALEEFYYFNRRTLALHTLEHNKGIKKSI